LLLCLVAATAMVVCGRLRIVRVLEVVRPIKSNVMLVAVGKVDQLLLLQIRGLGNHLLTHVVLNVAVVAVRRNFVLQFIVLLVDYAISHLLLRIGLCSL